MHRVQHAHNRELKIDNAVSSKTRCEYISTGRRFLEFDCFNNYLKLVLLTYKYFCWPKRYAFCYKLDFQNASYAVACFALLKGRDNSQFDAFIRHGYALENTLGTSNYSWLLFSIKISFVMKPRRRAARRKS